MKIATIIFAAQFFVTLGLAQIPSVELKVRERSGFLGMGPARHVSLFLSNKNRSIPLTSTNVNGDNLYFFVLKTIGDWSFDQGFIRNELMNFSLYQHEKKLLIQSTGEIDLKDSTLLIGFSKELRINDLFLAQFTSKSLSSSAEFHIPPEFWPGYDTFTSLSNDADQQHTNGNFLEAIKLYNHLLQSSELRIFPEFIELKTKRSKVFDSYLRVQVRSANEIMSDQVLPYKERITRIDSMISPIRFVVTTLPAESLGVSEHDPVAANILNRAETTLSRLSSARDSLQKLNEEENIRWIIEGGSAARTGYFFQVIVEALVYRLTSNDFTDTVSTSLRGNLPDRIQIQLVKYGLFDSYESFMRVLQKRYEEGVPIFPVEFLPNLKRDSSTFNQPYYRMLKGISDFLYGNFDGAAISIYTVLRYCSIPEISERYDRLRILIDVRQGKYPIESLRLAELAAKNDPTLSGTFFYKATSLAPDFGYLYFLMGKSSLLRKDTAQAVVLFQRSYQLDSLLLSAYREESKIYQRASRYDNMISVLRRAIQNGNNYWETFHNLGLAYLLNNEADLAIEYLESAYDINPLNYDTNVQLGLVFIEIDDLEKAREFFNNAINIDPIREEAVTCLLKLNELQRSRN